MAKKRFNKILKKSSKPFDQKRPQKSDRKTVQITPPKRQESQTFSDFISGPNAKWLFFVIYLLITIFLFRDFLFSDKMLFGRDTIPDGIYTRQYYKNYHSEFGGIPRWNPFILGGLPFIDAMHGDTFYPAAWLKFFMPLTRALGYKLILHVLLAGIFMYIFLRTLRLRREAAFLGGLMYMLAPSFVSWLYGGHDAKMYVIALLPLAFAFLESGMNNPKFFKFVALGGVMGLLILTSHVQMAYYAYWAIGLYVIFRLLFDSGKEKAGTIRQIMFFLVAVIIALMLGAVQLYPSYKFTTTQSVRAGEERTGYEYATSWSMHLEEAAGMIIPSFPGINYDDGRQDMRGRTYWGKNPFKLNTEYHGILPVIFGILALLMCRDRIKWYLFGIACLSLIYSLGANTPFYRLFYKFVPGIKNFRAPGMMIFLFCFAVVVLASKFISSVLEKKISLKPDDKKLLYAVGIVVVLAVIVSVMGRSFFELWQNIFYRSMPGVKASAMEANMPYFTGDLWRIVILVGVSLAGLWMFICRKIGSSALVILLALVIFIDEFSVVSRFITVIDPARYNNSAPDRVVGELRKKMSESMMPFRVLGLFSGKSQNYYAMFGIHTANGMHNNELQTYELFRGAGQYQNFTGQWIEGNSINPDGLSRNNFLKVAGVKYIILPIDEGRTELFENRFALERAFIVHDYITVENDSAAVELMKDISFDAAKKVIITGDSKSFMTDFREGSAIESFDVTKDGFNISADFKSHGFLVLAENLVPYWKAEVDGKPVSIHKAYGTFMAVECPQGKHEIQFIFRSSPYENGKKLTLVSLAFVIVSLTVTGVSNITKRKKKTV